MCSFCCRLGRWRHCDQLTRVQHMQATTDKLKVQKITEHVGFAALCRGSGSQGLWWRQVCKTVQSIKATVTPVCRMTPSHHSAVFSDGSQSTVLSCLDLPDMPQIILRAATSAAVALIIPRNNSAILQDSKRKLSGLDDLGALKPVELKSRTACRGWYTKQRIL